MPKTVVHCDGANCAEKHSTQDPPRIRKARMTRAGWGLYHSISFCPQCYNPTLRAFVDRLKAKKKNLRKAIEKLREDAKRKPKSNGRPTDAAMQDLARTFPRRSI